MLIKAVAKSKYKDKIHLILAGEGPKRRHYKKLVKKNGIDCEMRFFDHDELKEVLNAADLYVHTAYVELESIACLEAIVTGLVPIISSWRTPKNLKPAEKNIRPRQTYQDLASA